MDKTLQINKDETLFYREFGEGKAVILIPSLWVTSKSYVELGRELGRYYRVLIPDIFRGKSVFPIVATNIDAYAAKLDEFIRLLHIKSYNLIGVSLSGITATKYILKYPNRPNKMFLVSTTVLPLRIKRERAMLFWGYITLLYHNSFSWEDFTINWLWIADGIENAWRHFRQAWTEGIIATSLKIENVQRLPVSTRLVFALRDEFIPQEAVSRLSKVKNLQIEVVDRYHGWFFKHENQLVKKIVEFFG